MTPPRRRKTVRDRVKVDGIPGLPDALPDVPPKAREYEGLTLDEAIARAHAILDTVQAGATVPVEQVATRPSSRVRRNSPITAELLTDGVATIPLQAGATDWRTIRLHFNGWQIVLDPATVANATVNNEPAQPDQVLQPGDALTTGAHTCTIRYWRKLAPPDPGTTFTLFSGGGDSSILAHLMRDRTDALVHVRTGISIPETWQYVQAVAQHWGAKLHAAHPDVTYQDLVLGKVPLKTSRGKRPAGEPVWVGFPGPAGHYLMYQRLKESALAAFRNSIVGDRGRGGQIVFLGGMRWAESDRRFLNADEYDQWGSVIWCSPLVWWTSSHTREYRARHMCNDVHDHPFGRLCRPDSLPLSPVTEKLHMSGDCLCGAFAKPGELGEIEFWYPSTAAELHALQDLAKAAGIERCAWGAGKQPGEKAPKKAGRLCSSCTPPMPGEVDLFTQWRDAGLISDQQYAQHVEAAA